MASQCTFLSVFHLLPSHPSPTQNTLCTLQFQYTNDSAIFVTDTEHPCPRGSNRMTSNSNRKVMYTSPLQAPTSSDKFRIYLQ